MMNFSLLSAVSVLASTIIGAGIFSLPFIFKNVGLLFGAFYLFLFAAVYGAIHYMYVRVLQTTEEKHQFTYFAEKYLGTRLGKIVGGAVLLELFFVLTAYLVLAPQFISIAIGISGWQALILFWILGSIVIFIPSRLLGWADLFGIGSILLIVGIIVMRGGQNAALIPAAQPLNWFLFLLPFGPLLFSLSGRPALASIVEEWRRARKSFSLGGAILLGTFIPAIVYFFFVVGVLRLNPFVSPEALTSLTTLPLFLYSLLGALGIVALWTSYFMIGISARDTIQEDMRASSWISACTVLFLPLILVVISSTTFLSLISFIGGIFLALEGVVVITMWRRAFPQHSLRNVVLPLYSVFVAAFLFEILRLFI
ncbi:MAG: aromatic amino acid transport family protein [Candidatus Paceibacterota bacterium]|jgi:amino acid permease